MNLRLILCLPVALPLVLLALIGHVAENALDRLGNFAGEP